MHERHLIVPPSVARGYGKGLNTVMCHSERLRGATPAFDWPHPMTISQSHIFPPQSLSSNRRTELYGGLIVTEKKRGGGGEMEGERNH